MSRYRSTLVDLDELDIEYLLELIEINLATPKAPLMAVELHGQLLEALTVAQESDSV